MKKTQVSNSLIDVEPKKVVTLLSKMPKKVSTFPPVKRRYSVTADILSYRRCKRQYGFFVRRNYTSAQSGQLFFGTVIHETLDKAHAHYRGELEGVAKGSFPTDVDIERYFKKAESSLRGRGIRPLSKESRDKALEYIQRFNSNFGCDVYPRVVDTEHRLEKDKGTYMLQGVVDVIARSADFTNWGNHEIWDYKGLKRPDPGRDPHDFENYEFQMRVYAHLYQIRNKVWPNKAILWFLGEPDKNNQKYEVNIDQTLITQAVSEFERTVQDIEQSINSDDWSNIITTAPPKDTCDACDIRWNCPIRKYKLRAL